MKTYSLANRRYLGCKTKLVDYIKQIVNENCIGVKTFADIFAGTGVVGYSFFDSCDVIVNDNLLSNYYSYLAFFSNQKINKSKLEKLFDEYNMSAPQEDNYYSENFADTYLSTNNMKKVGYIRDDIDNRFSNHEINEREKAILISSLLYSIDRIANTVGHYDAYRKNGDLSQKLEMMMPLIKNSNHKCSIYKEDANQLVKHITADVVYIDPPYNSRQYSDAYHFLENVAINSKPEVYGVAKKMNRSQLKSKYCTSKATDEFADLIESINAKYIILSYNNTGNKSNDRSNARISDDDILRILSTKGSVKVFEQDFNNFTTGKSEQLNHKERLFLCNVGQYETQDFNGELIDTPSPLNYTGGKYKLLGQLRERFPRSFDVFIDMFCGGCNVSANSSAKETICVDNCPELISLLRYLKNTNYDTVLTELETKISYYGLSNTYKYGYDYYHCESGKGVGQFNKHQFIALRNDYNKNKNDILFLLLIIFSFNNQIRFNNDGHFNLPVGKRDFNASVRKKLKNFMHNIQCLNISFLCQNFNDFDLDILIPDESFIYLDPPYYLGDASYNENGGWTEENEKELLAFLVKCNSKGIRFALSNVIEHKGNKHFLLIDWCLTNGFNINYLNKSYSNSNYHIVDKSLDTKEVLITNY